MLIIPEKEVPKFKRLLVTYYEDKDNGKIMEFMKSKCIKTFWLVGNFWKDFFAKSSLNLETRYNERVSWSWICLHAFFWDLVKSRQKVITFIITIILTKVITFSIIVYRKMGGDCVLSKKRIELPETHTATEFLRGQASRIFDDVAKNNKIVVVVKHSKPQNVIMSYEEYKKLTKEEG